MSSVQWNHNFPQIARESGFRLNRPTGGFLDWRLIGTYVYSCCCGRAPLSSSRHASTHVVISKSKIIAGSIDVDWLVKENDLDRLDSVQSHLSGAPLSSLLLHNSVLDGSVVKYFELAQLSIQFLLFCKQFLDQSVTTLRNNFCELRRKNEKLERLCKRRNEELLAVHSQQQPQLHGSGKTAAVEEPKSRTLVCPKCCKDAINSSGMEIEKMASTVGPPFSRNHHSPAIITKASVKESYDQGSYDDSMEQEEQEADNRNTAVDGEENRSQRIENRDINLINAIKLELEVKHLRARLAEVEMELGEQRGEGLVQQSSSPCQPATTVPPEEQHEQVVRICEWGETASVEHKQLPGKRDVGVQIDGISIVHQTEKASVIVGSGVHVEPTTHVDDHDVLGNKTNIEGGTEEERLMALVQEQLSKALEQWTTTTTVSVKPEDVISRELEPDQMPWSSSAKLGLSRKPTEIISIAADMSPAHDDEAQRLFFEDMRRVLQDEVRSIERHWQTKYSQLEKAFHDNGQCGGEEELVAKLVREDVQKPNHRMTDEGLHEEDHKSNRLCRQPPAESKTCRRSSLQVDREIDKNELLMPQVGVINTENWQAAGGRQQRHRHHHQQATTTAMSAKRVQLGSSHKTDAGFLSATNFSSSTRVSESESTSYGDNEEEAEEQVEDGEDEEYSEECDWNNLLSRATATASVDPIVGDPIDSDCALAPSTPEVNEGVRRKVICELGDRLLDMGIQAKRKGITSAALNTATCHLADERDLRKSKWKKFFVMRNRVVSKVNGLMAARMGREQQIIREVLRQEVKQPMEIKSSRDLKSSGNRAPQQQSLTLRERGGFSLPSKSEPTTRDGSENEMSDGGPSNLVTMFNRIPEVDDGCSSDEDRNASVCAQGRKKGDEPLCRQKGAAAAEVVPKPLPRKVLFNLSENNRKLGSLESFESEKEVRIG